MPEHFYITLAELSAAYGVNEARLIFYEQHGFLLPIEADGVRFYNKRDRLRLELIVKGQRLGFSLNELQTLILSDTTS